ncbi:la protein 1 [Melia azedarach]|uniref:La protein 1 n=1 Tax=Melia azedarach TaxID=155640 RepID=A0ACC1YIF1_MELAZ|nr:la protein 1 [Melia azedarach]
MPAEVEKRLSLVNYAVSSCKIGVGISYGFSILEVQKLKALQNLGTIVEEKNGLLQCKIRFGCVSLSSRHCGCCIKKAGFCFSKALPSRPPSNTACPCLYLLFKPTTGNSHLLTPDTPPSGCPRQFIDFKIGAESGCIRFEEPDSAGRACAAAVLDEEGSLTMKNFTTVLEPVSGEAEKEYWSLLRGNQERHREIKGFRGRSVYMCYL